LHIMNMLSVGYPSVMMPRFAAARPGAGFHAVEPGLMQKLRLVDEAHWYRGPGNTPGRGEQDLAVSIYRVGGRINIHLFPDRVPEVQGLLEPGYRPEQIYIELDPATGDIGKIQGLYDPLKPQRGLSRMVKKPQLKALLETLLGHMNTRNLLV
jgi:hypothetical protein